MSQPNPVQSVMSKLPKQLSGKLLISIVAATLLAMIFIGFTLLSSLGSTANDIARLGARLETLQRLIAEGQKNARSPDVIKISTDASILIRSDTASLEITAGQAAFKTKNKTILSSEADLGLFDELKTAAINGRFDEVYTSRLRDKLVSTQLLGQTIAKKTAKPALKSMLLSFDSHLTSLLSQIDKL